MDHGVLQTDFYEVCDAIVDSVSGLVSVNHLNSVLHLPGQKRNSQMAAVRFCNVFVAGFPELF